MYHNNSKKIKKSSLKKSKTISNRKRLGWKKEDFNKPVRKYNRLLKEEDEKLKQSGVPLELFYNRLYNGWDREEALTRPQRKYTKISDEERHLMEENGIDETTFRTRVSRKMNRYKAATTPKNNQ
ncbi:hypothetical protein [Staphylococcus equorum]|uniref:hypothetical protein n=1 Tax=Staphylococcus equorum TaxID=246432 RepID=UPI000852FAC1|nr:hypothetical protein [Staphylococcus equorum]OEL08248.1 hypothetical protein AST04_08670 [Staphylococcus equorum]